jgi:UDP-N-acetylmuramoyl-tripeptide--D-alanyl-D-alanine ligase
MSLRALVRALDGEATVWGTPPGEGPMVRSLSTDTRTLQPGDAYVALCGERFNGADFLDQAFEQGASCAIVAQGVVVDAPSGQTVIACQDPVQALGQLAGEHRRSLSSRVVAITGSCGKTSTRELLRALLTRSARVTAAKASFNNEVGLPLTLLAADEDTEITLCEIGTNAPGEIRALTRIALPDVAVLTRIAPAHLEGLGTIEGVFREKSALIKGLRQSTGVAVLNADDPRVMRCVELTARPVITYGFSPWARVRGEVTPAGSDQALKVFIEGATPFTLLLPFPGRHQALNALGALATARALGFDVAKIAHRLEYASLPQGRLEVHDVDGLTVIHDAYNANPASTRAALEVLSESQGGRRVLVFGDMLELGETGVSLHEAVGQQAAEVGLDAMVGVGSLAARACAAAQKAGLAQENVHCAEDASEVAAWLRGRVGPGDTILLKGSRGMRLERVLKALATPHSSSDNRPDNHGRDAASLR